MVTTAPETLKAARALLLDHLPLDPAAVGIVGDPAHRGGYHCGDDRVVSGDYSVVESARDRTGLAQWACALDVGEFTAGSHTLRGFSVWLAGQCAADAPDTRDIREVIYSPDGSTVKRWDRLGKRSSGDSSHRWHTHISFHRDAIKAGRDQTPLFRRYLTTIGLLEDDMPLTDADAALVARAVLNQTLGRTAVTVGQVLQSLPGAIATEGTSPAELTAALAGLPQPAPLDVDALASALAPKLVTSLPADSPITDEQLERVLRTVLGSLNDAPQS